MHPAIFSLKNLTPVVCIDLERCYAGRESKTRSLLVDMELMESHIDFNEIGRDLGRANAVVRQIMDRWDPQFVKRKVQVMTDRVDAFLGRIFECVEGEHGCRTRGADAEQREV
jgi:hypothetical protein